jgi:hypothetical protein
MSVGIQFQSNVSPHSFKTSIVSPHMFWMSVGIEKSYLFISPYSFQTIMGID